MRLHVLGSSASSPAPGDACSGYLVSHGSTNLMLDCGSGTLSRLRELTTLEDLSAIYISHFHPDHYLDLITMRYALRYARESHARLPLLVPPGAQWFLMELGLALRRNGGFFTDTFDIREYSATRCMDVGELTLNVQRTTHDEPNWAVGVSAGLTRLVYTGDTRACRDLEDLARGADMLLCEATYPTVTNLPSDNHLTGRQAGALARRARVRHLVLTHFWPEFERAEIAAEAAAEFDGRTTCAVPGLEFDIVPELAEAQRA
jgi:ribonuclease BN (tRNA processing enzyme)